MTAGTVTITKEYTLRPAKDGERCSAMTEWTVDSWGQDEQAPCSKQATLTMGFRTKRPNRPVRLDRRSYCSPEHMSSQYRRWFGLYP